MFRRSQNHQSRKHARTHTHTHTRIVRVKYIEKSKYHPNLSESLMQALFHTVAKNAFRTFEPPEDELDGKPRMPVCLPFWRFPMFDECSTQLAERIHIEDPAWPHLEKMYELLCCLIMCCSPPPPNAAEKEKDKDSPPVCVCVLCVLCCMCTNV